MPWANDMQVLGAEMVNSLEKRIEELYNLKKEVQSLLADYEVQREEMSEELAATLATDRKELIKEVADLLEIYNKERSKAHKIWEDTLNKLSQLK